MYKLLAIFLVMSIQCYGLTVEERLFNTFINHGVDSNSARIFVAQAHFESNGFRNKLSKDHNNVFSILHDKYRPLTKSVGPLGYAEGKSGWASYRSVEDAAVDFLYFLDYWGVSRYQRTITGYVRALKSLTHPVKKYKREYFTDDIKVYINGMIQRYRLLYGNYPLVVKPKGV